MSIMEETLLYMGYGLLAILAAASMILGMCCMVKYLGKE